MIEIPFRQLAADVLNALIEEFIHRNGTDYGEIEFSLAEKVEQIKRQLQSNEVLVVYDEETETTNIISKHSLRT
jgi:uncharacterized protein YheU (UPF0270 family)